MDEAEEFWWKGCRNSSSSMESNALSVVKMDALCLHVRLDTLDNKELMVKPEKVRPLLPTASKLQE